MGFTRLADSPPKLASEVPDLGLDRVVVYGTDVAGRLQLVNESWQRICGFAGAAAEMVMVMVIVGTVMTLTVRISSLCSVWV